MTPICNSEMLKQYLEDQLQNDTISQTTASLTPNLSSPVQATSQSISAGPDTVPDIFSKLLDANTEQLPSQINTEGITTQQTECPGFLGDNGQLFTNLLKPPDISSPATSVTNTSQEPVSISASNFTDVLQEMLASNDQHMTKEPTTVAESVPLIVSTYNSANIQNTGLLATAFSLTDVNMRTTESLVTGLGPGSQEMTIPVTTDNSCVLTVVQSQSNMLCSKSELTSATVGQSVFSMEQSQPQAVSLSFGQKQQPLMTTVIGGNITPNGSGAADMVKVVSDTAPIHASPATLPADLANVNLQMFAPVSIASGNIDPQTVLKSVANQQSTSEVPPTVNPTTFNQSAYTNSDNFPATSTSNFLNVEIPVQSQSAMAEEMRDILATDTKPKLTISAARTDQQHSMLRQMLTNNPEVDNSSLSPSPVSSPEENVPESASSISSPNSVFHDPVSQLTLINKSEKLRIEQDDDEEAVNDLFDISCFKSDPVETDIPSKIQKSKRNSDAHTNLAESEISVEKLFDAGGADSIMDFKFTKFGQDNQPLFKFGSTETVNTSGAVTRTQIASTITTGSLKSMAPPIQKPHGRKVKELGLGSQFPAKTPHYELRILSQPEEQHRARYLTEGSRGAVKDRSQQSYPVVKLFGHNEPVTLQIFVGNETGRVKPHGFYQACKVSGKNSAPSKEREIEGTVVIETEMTPSTEMSINVDCVGILKLRNADVEKRIGVAKARAKKKNSTKARLIFRVTFQKPDGNQQTLQVASSPIICTQPVGQPEISRMSLEESPSTGGQDLFVIGKNFLKGTQVKFQEISVDDGSLLWEKEAEIDQEYFQQTHLICKVPEYNAKSITTPLMVHIVIHCRGKISDPQQFHYNPVLRSELVEVPMETDQNQSKGAPSCVSPVALELNRLVERTQNSPAVTPNMFQLPPGAVPGISPLKTPQPQQPQQVAQPVPTQAVLPMVKQENELAQGQTTVAQIAVAPTLMETSQSVQQQQQQPLCQQQQQPSTNAFFNKTLLDLLTATSNQQAQQTVQPIANQPNTPIILFGNPPGQGTIANQSVGVPVASPTTPSQPPVGVVQQQASPLSQPQLQPQPQPQAPMIVILPGNNQNVAPMLQTQTAQQANMLQVETLLKTLLGQQNGLS